MQLFWLNTILAYTFIETHLLAKATAPVNDVKIGNALFLVCGGAAVIERVTGNLK